MERAVTHAASGLTASEQDERARGRLLRAAADVFDRKGYAAASVREIVEQAGTTKPVLYYHFGSKEGMLVAILDEGARRLQTAVSRALTREGTVRTRLMALCEEIHGLFKENVPAVRVAHALYFGPKESWPEFDFRRFERTIGGAIRRLAEEGVANGELRPAGIDDVALAINGILSVCTHHELDRYGNGIEADGIHRVLDLVFDGLVSTDERKEN